MASLPQMKDQLKDAYRGSQQWADKVDKMSKAQVLAIRRRLIEQKIIKV